MILKIRLVQIMSSKDKASDSQQNELNKFSELAKRLFSVPKVKTQPKQKPNKA